jgi:hypothetical protein
MHLHLFIVSFMLASVAFVLIVFGSNPPQAEAGRATVNVFSPAPCPAPAAKWCHKVGGLAE